MRECRSETMKRGTEKNRNIPMPRHAPAEIAALLPQARRLAAGSGERTPAVRLHDADLVRLTAALAHDLGLADRIASIPEALAGHGYLSPPAMWPLRPVDPVPILEEAMAAIPDFPAAFRSLCEIEKRRIRVRDILRHHPVPDPDEVASRAVLEYGLLAPSAHGAWMRWRKWLYDIDNRIAQQAGYLLAPVIATALGGRPVGALQSPVRRVDAGFRRRNVDCLSGTTAYDIKARLSDAPSRRARLDDEIAFARDCRFSSLVPVLLVLGPASGERAAELADAYRAHGGEALIGEVAWDHVAARASMTMARVVDLYIRGPMRDIASHAAMPPLELAMRDRPSIRIGRSQIT